MIALFSHIKTERYQMKILGSSLKANKRKHFSIQHVIKLQNSSKCACSAWAPEIMKLIEETFSKDYSTETSGSQRIIHIRRILWRSSR